MADETAAAVIAKLGWRQGSVLGRELVTEAIKVKPERVKVEDSDRLIVTSHHCDIANPSLKKEPVVEVLRAAVSHSAPATHFRDGRNPRELHLPCAIDGCPVNLCCNIHDRWAIGRELLSREAPHPGIVGKPRRIFAEWLAKRYIRAAFPSEFDRRRSDGSNDWQALLKKNSEWIQGVYLRLNTLDELTSDQPYQCDLLVAVPAEKRKGARWADEKDRLVGEVECFWESLEPGIICNEVDVLGTDEITLDRIEQEYQRLDADWVSYADDSPLTPAIVDMST